MSNKEKEAQKLIISEIEKSHKLLIDHLDKFCDETKGTSIPMVYIRQSSKILIQGYQSSVCSHDFKENELKIIQCTKCGITKDDSKPKE